MRKILTRLKLAIGALVWMSAAATAQSAGFEENIRLSARDLFPDVAPAGLPNRQ